MVSHFPFVEGMHERKTTMYNLADAFIVMPGGVGTIEGFFGAFTWIELGYHLKPIGLLLVEGFFTPFMAFLKNMASQGFCRQEQLDTLLLDDVSGLLIERLKKTKLRPIPKHG